MRLETVTNFLRMVVITVLVFLLSAVYSTTWMTTLVVSRTQKDIYVPLAFKVAVGLLLFLGFRFLVRLRLPHFSLRLVQSGITVGILCYFLSPLLMFLAIRVLPSGAIALAFAFVPFILNLAGFGELKKLWFPALLALAGLGLVFFDVWKEAFLRGDATLSLAYLAGSLFSYCLGLGISKKLMWLHSSDELGFWALLSAVILFMILGFLSGETFNMRDWPKTTTMYLGYLSFVIGGLGMFLYRYIGFKGGRIGTFIVTLTVPAGAMALGFWVWGETGVGPIGWVGMGILLVSLAVGTEKVPVGRWLCLYPGNDVRGGERLTCKLMGFVRAEQSKISKIEIQDIAVGGIGFLSEHPFKNGDHLIVNIRLGDQFSQVSLEGKVTHIRSSGNLDMPWHAGLQFQEFPGTVQGYLVEFLARLSQEMI